MRCTSTVPNPRTGIPRPVQWGGGTCPVCERERKFSQVIEDGRIKSTCHVGTCSQEDIKAALAKLFPGCAGRRPRRPPISADDLAALMLSGIPPMSMKLAGLEMTGMGTTAALDKLGVRREHRARVITERAPFSVQNRR